MLEAQGARLVGPDPEAPESNNWVDLSPKEVAKTARTRVRSRTGEKIPSFEPLVFARLQRDGKVLWSSRTAD